MMTTLQRPMAVDTTNSTYTGTMQSQKSSKHRSVLTLQDMMSADETLTGLPTRVPERRLGARKTRDVLVAIEKNGNPQKLDEEQPIRRRRKSDFEIYRDGRVERKGGSSLETATAVISTSPASLRNKSPSYLEQRRTEKEIEALENEYVNNRRAKAASPTQEDTEDEIIATVPQSHTRNQPSISNLLSHGNPDPQFTPLPAPPLSLLHRKFASLTTPSPVPQKAPKISPTPVLPPSLPDQDISPLQHMRAFRAHFEALLPAPQPQPQPQPQPRRRSQSQAPPRQQSPSQQPPPPRQNPPKAHSSSSSSCNSPASFAHQYAFTLSHLTPLTHHSKTAIVSLTPTNPYSSGFITLQLRNLAELKGGGKYTYIIPTHGLPVTVTDHESGSRNTYEIEDLPLKHLQAVRYAKHFVDVVKKGTIVGRVEVREKFGGGAVWLGRRWGDGRFEALKEGAEGGVVVEIQGERGDKVRVFKNGKSKRETARYEKVIDRAQRMWSACNRVLEEAEQTEDEGDRDIVSEGSDETTTIRKRAEMVSPSRNSSSQGSATSEPHAPELDKTFRIDATTTFVPNVGWCRRASDNGWWSMLFFDGVRLEIDSTSGDAVWIERGGARKVLRRGMEMKNVRERVTRFVEQGL